MKPAFHSCDSFFGSPRQVHPVIRHAFGDSYPTESFYEAPELCHLILKWHAQKSKMIVGPCKFEHRMVAVDVAGVERCKVLTLASRIAASWYTFRGLRVFLHCPINVFV